MIVGQKVVCINDEFHQGIRKLYTDLPKKDVIYTVRSVELGANDKAEPGEVCIRLVELKNPKGTVAPFPERGFNAERFAPLEEKPDEQAEEEIREPIVHVPTGEPVCV